MQTTLLLGSYPSADNTIDVLLALLTKLCVLVCVWERERKREKRQRELQIIHKNFEIYFFILSYSLCKYIATLGEYSNNSAQFTLNESLTSYFCMLLALLHSPTKKIVNQYVKRWKEHNPKYWCVLKRKKENFSSIQNLLKGFLTIKINNRLLRSQVKDFDQSILNDFLKIILYEMFCTQICTKNWRVLYIFSCTQEQKIYLT